MSSPPCVAGAWIAGGAGVPHAAAGRPAPRKRGYAPPVLPSRRSAGGAQSGEESPSIHGRGIGGNPSPSVRLGMTGSLRSPIKEPNSSAGPPARRSWAPDPDSSRSCPPTSATTGAARHSATDHRRAGRSPVAGRTPAPPALFLALVLALIPAPLFAAGESNCVALERSDARAALACYDEILATKPEAATLTRLLTNRAWVLVSLGDHGAAMQSFRDALAAARETGNRSHEASLINFIGLIHQFTGDIPAAIANYDHALSLARDLGDRKTESVALYHLGWVNFLRRDWTLSAQWYERSLAVAREIGDAASEARNLTGLGRTFHASGEYQRALTVDGEALELSRRTGDRQAEAEALDNLGIALTFLGRPDEAVERHRQSMQIRTAGGETWARTMTLSGLARALQAAGRIEEASEAMSQIVEMLDAGRRRLSARRYKAAFSSFAWGHYARAIELRMALGDANGAVSLSERARARLTLDAVQQSLAGSGSPDAALFSREDALRDAIERMERQRDTGPSVQASTTGERIEALRAELEEVGSQIHRAFPALDNARHAEPLGVDALRSELLSGGTALLEYFLGPERSYVWVVTHDSVVYRELPSRQAIEAEAAKLHQLLAAGDQRATRRTVAKALESFSRQILPPLPAAAGKLIIVPDGALFHVPFAALSEGGTPLVDRFEIVLAPSASAVALLLRRDPKTGSGIAVFADPVFRADDPRIAGAKSGAGAARSKRDSVRSAASRSEIAALPRLFWSRAEADDIVRLTSGRAVKALDFEASRRRLLSEDLSRYRILHFATHALVDGSSPEQSGIVLSMVDSRGRPVDGFLRVHDLYGLSGAPGLVVLSACRTALGGEVRGEGIVGLVSGFMNAGTPRVVASYWNVKDRATKEMMQRFYAGVFERGMAPAAALRAAQKSMRADPRWMAPYYWASFALYGAP